LKVVLKLPRVSMNMEDATITAWLKKPGERFIEGEALYSIETEKSATDIERWGRGRSLKSLPRRGLMSRLAHRSAKSRLEVAGARGIGRADRSTKGCRQHVGSGETFT
jgi:hypothetical protein